MPRFKSIISDPSIQKSYMRNVYSRSWSQRRVGWGFDESHKMFLARLMENVAPGRILEVAIGDGEPYARQLIEFGFQVHGIDISPSLVREVQVRVPQANVKVGDAEALEFPDGSFDAVYCFRSTWYFPDLCQAIREMVRVAKDGGFVMFEIRNANHAVNVELTKKFISRRARPPALGIAYRYARNVAKVALSPFKYYARDWSVHEVTYLSPTDPREVTSLLREIDGVAFVASGVNWATKTLDAIGSDTELDRYDRLVYEVRKGGPPPVCASDM